MHFQPHKKCISLWHCHHHHHHHHHRPSIPVNSPPSSQMVIKFPTNLFEMNMLTQVWRTDVSMACNAGFVPHSPCNTYFRAGFWETPIEPKHGGPEALSAYQGKWLNINTLGFFNTFPLPQTACEAPEGKWERGVGGGDADATAFWSCTACRDKNRLEDPEEEERT